MKNYILIGWSILVVVLGLSISAGRCAEKADPWSTPPAGSSFANVPEEATKTILTLLPKESLLASVRFSCKYFFRCIQGLDFIPVVTKVKAPDKAIDGDLKLFSIFCQKISFLDLARNSHITIQALTCLNNLTSLDFGTHGYSEKIYSQAFGVYIDKVFGYLDDENVIYLTRLTQLKLGFSEFKLTDAGLTTLTNVTDLTVRGGAINITPKSIRYMFGLKKLTIEDENFMGRNNDDTLYWTGLTELYLDIGRCNIIGSGIPKLTNLTSFTLGKYFEGATNNDIQQMTRLEQFILLGGGNSINEEGLKHLTNLKVLHLLPSYSKFITDYSVFVVIMTNLQELHLGNRDLINQGEYNRLQINKPNLKITWNMKGNKNSTWWPGYDINTPDPRPCGTTF